MRDTSDKTKVWHEMLRGEILDKFRATGYSPTAIFFLDAENDRMGAFHLNEYSKDEIPGVIDTIIKKADPDAYIFITEGSAIFTKDGKEALDKIEKAGGIGNLRESRDVLVVYYETRFVKLHEVFEVVREGGDFVISEEPILSSTVGDSKFSGFLNKGNDLTMLN